ncbi:MAG TPA: NAD(P)H-dependent oxidoreductase [Candidatus Humimicrobiaceae bacterium]|nr:MAG: NAD(P)H dehydrogenase [Candidatus Atribacteria bacterium RBG_16_35_8]
MKISVILAHPRKGSFNHAIAGVITTTLGHLGHEVFFHDLYTEKFNPVLPEEEILEDRIFDPVIQKYCEEISESDGIIIVHPNWWGQPPAILKGWVDRVLRPGVAYKFLEGDGGEGKPHGLLKAGTALVFNTSNTPAGREKKVFEDPLENLWNNCIFGLCGVKNFYRKMYGVIVTSTPEKRKSWLEDVRKTVEKYFT